MSRAGSGAHLCVQGGRQRVLLDPDGALGMVGADIPRSSVAVTEAAWTLPDCSQHLLSK